MAVPYIFDDAFEGGTFGNWDVAESDTSNILDCAHYTTLARDKLAMPYGGAYCARWVMDGTTDDATIGDGDFDIADGVTRWIGFNIWFGSDLLDSTADDTVHLIELQRTTGNGIELAMGFFFDVSEGTLHWSVGDALADQNSTGTIETNTWYHVDLKCTVSTGGAGEIALYATRDGHEPSTTANISQATITNTAAVVRGIFGIQGQAATTVGTILMDDVRFDDAQIYPIKDRWACTKTLTKSGHLFVGQGCIDSISVVANTTGDSVVTVYDTDTAQTYQSLKKAIIKATTGDETIEFHAVPFDVTRGAFVEITGTGAGVPGEVTQATFTIGKAIHHSSEGAVSRYGLTRKLQP